MTDTQATRDEARAVLQQIAETVEEESQRDTDGKWLEEATRDAAPLLADWDIDDCWQWGEWPEREKHLPDTDATDVGIDLVARRKSDWKHIAIQCKARNLTSPNAERDIPNDQIAKFGNASQGSFWAERWIVTNATADIGRNAKSAESMSDKPFKLLNLQSELFQHYDVDYFSDDDEECDHCDEAKVAAAQETGEAVVQTKSCMQREAVREAVRLLRKHESAGTGGRPKGQARGKIVLPCGTGKTRISLRIVEELTGAGELSVVLCPSIALVAQLRREYLTYRKRDLRVLAVCSDPTAGYDPKHEDDEKRALDPTADLSNVSEKGVKGQVTTDAGEITEWILAGGGGRQKIVRSASSSAPTRVKGA